MINPQPHRASVGILVLLGVLSALLFVLAGLSFIVRGIPGYAMAAGGGLGIGLLAMTARRTRPSPLSTAVLIGTIAGAVPAVWLVREWSLAARFAADPWAQIILTFSAACGGAAAYFPVIREAIDAARNAPKT